MHFQRNVSGDFVSVNGQIPCSCSDPTHVRWQRQGRALPVHRLESSSEKAITDFGKSIIIRNVLPADAGKYICSHVPSGLNHTIDVTVVGGVFFAERLF